MAHYLFHEKCPACNSRDNLARYSDGGAFCFGCHYTERATRYVPKSDVRKEYEKAPKLSREFSSECVQWVFQYGLSLEDILRRGCGWNAERQQLVFTFPDVLSGDNTCWQARNFREGSKSKYYTQGDVNELIPIYSSGRDDGRLVVVEDCISAIKVARHCDSMPVLGSHVSNGKLHRLSKLFHTIYFWLDSDKLKESRNAADRARLIGINSSVIYTEDDPKCISDGDINVALSH